MDNSAYHPHPPQQPIFATLDHSKRQLPPPGTSSHHQHPQQQPIQQQSKRQSKTQQAQQAKEKEDHQTLIGIQAQNIYLLNYINKMEFLLQETIKERKREKKQHTKQLNTILKAACTKPSISKDIDTLEYYLGLTHGLDDRMPNRKVQDSDDEGYTDSDNDLVQHRILAGQKRPKELKESSLLNILGYQPPALDSDDKKPSEFKSEKELKLDFLKKEIQEHSLDKKKKNDHTDDDFIRQIEQVRERISKNEGNDTTDNGLQGAPGEGDSITEYQISDFMRNEWNTLAKVTSKLVSPNVAQK